MVKEAIRTGKCDDILLDLYIDEGQLPYQRKRYVRAIEKFEELYGEKDFAVFSAPGRSEIGGNHTDHQRGKVLAAALNVDMIAVAGVTEERKVKIVSEGYPMITIDLAEIFPNEKEKGTTPALVKGILAGFVQRGYEIGGFCAYITNDVLSGAGISSSAAFETLIGTVVSCFFNEGKISPAEIAMIGQYAENVYFGKPCGLMDQMASAVGNLVYIDFTDAQNPLIEQPDCDFEKFGYTLCITDTKSSHADATPEYAAIPSEMKAVAKELGKNVLGEIPEEILFENISKIREKTGDRAVLRAIHFMQENKRVQAQFSALCSGDFEEFLRQVKASGDSSFKYLQNVYMNSDTEHQNVSLALAVSEVFLGQSGVCRVHGGGFAGTIQAFVKKAEAGNYCRKMNEFFGEGTCTVYRIRKYGGRKVF